VPAGSVVDPREIPTLAGHGRVSSSRIAALADSPNMVGCVPPRLRNALEPRRRRVAANDLDFGVLELGSGPLALCLHGFPDSAYTWRHLLPALAAGGFRAVAPFMRGYAPTGIPTDGCYDLGALVADAVALHEALGGDEPAALIGHDWGAEAAYGAAALAPERWRRLVTLAVPPLAVDARIFSDYSQLKRLFYVFFFKTPHADAVVAADDMAFLDRLWADWSPGYDASDHLGHAKRCLRDPQHLADALGYYRADEPGIQPGGPPDRWAAEHDALRRTPPQPTLYLHGERDGCIDLTLAADAPQHLSAGSRMDVIEHAGHFPHLEHPDLVNKRILAWITA
jgi:pimeloyl-ACP methyl ester carboxylesterase